MRTSVLFGAYSFEFFEIYDVSARTRGGEGSWASADIFRTRERGVNFSRFCADVFYGRPLSKNPHIFLELSALVHELTELSISGFSCGNLWLYFSILICCLVSLESNASQTEEKTFLAIFLLITEKSCPTQTSL